MTTLFTRSATILAAITVLASLSYARTGPGSGNGDGDRAFALQKMAAASPGLTPQQVLLKAFEESAGRLPTLIYAKPYKHDGSGYVSVGQLAGVVTKDGNVTGIELTMDPSDSRPSRISYFPAISRTVPDLGPLFPNPTAEVSYNVIGVLQSLSGSVNTCNSSLCMMDYHRPWLEFRAYNENTIIFITRPIERGSNNQLTCVPFSNIHNNGSSGNPAKASDICSVGYVWLE